METQRKIISKCLRTIWIEYGIQRGKRYINVYKCPMCTYTVTFILQSYDPLNIYESTKNFLFSIRTVKSKEEEEKKSSSFVSATHFHSIWCTIYICKIVFEFHWNFFGLKHIFCCCPFFLLFFCTNLSLAFYSQWIVIIKIYNENRLVFIA